MTECEFHRVVVLGAGFGGLAVAHRLAADGIDDVLILERSDGVGGTWRANRYPGAACDVPSHLYSMSFAPNPDWSRAFATQPEILAYVEDCYDRFDLRRKVRTDATVTSLVWDDDRGRWTVNTADGAAVEAEIVVSAVGMFNTPKQPAIEGLDRFAGRVVHSARWDPDVELVGKRVAVIGTGASAIQLVPAIVDDVAHLDLYQRTAPWILPRKDEPYSDQQKREFAERPEVASEHRRVLHDMLEVTTTFIPGDPVAETLATVANDYLDRKVVDPGLREILRPRHPFGCTRTLISSDWYPAVQRPNVDVVTESITEITETGVRTADGSERPVDVILACTGFHAADYLRGIEVVGRDGVDLHDRWAGVPRAYLGICVPSFPNFFMLYGPNTNQGSNSILLMLEAQADFVARALDVMDADGVGRIEVTGEVMDRYVADLERDLAATVWVSCHSYFRTAAGEIVTQLPHKVGWYREATERIERADFLLGEVPCTTS